MPVKLNFDQDKGLLVGLIESPLLVDDAKASFQQMRESSEYPVDVPTLWDLRALDFNGVDRDLEDRIIALRKAVPERGNARLAIVVADDLGFGMARMYQILSDELPQHILVSRDYTEAENWLLEEVQ